MATTELPGDGAKVDLPLPTTAAPLLKEVGEVVDRLVESFPNDLDCLEMKARYQDWVRKSEDAVKTWEKCLELDPGYIHAYLGMAAVAAKRGDHEKAAELARKAMQIAPSSFRARWLLAEAMLNLGKPAEVIPVLEKFLRKDPRSHGYFLLGRAYDQLKQYDKARENYEASIRQYPKYAEAYYALARVMVRLGRKDEARALMTKYRALMATRNPGRQGMDMTPDSFEGLCKNAAIIYTDSGRIHRAHEQPAEAERLWRRAAALSPGNVACRQALAWLCRTQGRIPETIRWLEELAKLDPENASYWLEIGSLHVGLAQLDPAEEAFRKACEVAPQDARGPAALAAMYLRSGRNLSESLTLARSAVKLAPTATNYELLAAACQRNGDEPGAAAAREQAAKLKPSHGEN